VAVGSEVRADTTVSTISSSASLNSSLDDDVADDTLVHVQSLGLSVCLQVNEEFFDGFASLFWPTAEGDSVHLAGLCSSSDTSRVLSVWNDGLVLNDSVHVLDRFLQLHALAEARCFVAVLVVVSQVGNSALRRFGGLGWLSRVLNHCKSLPIY